MISLGLAATLHGCSTTLGWKVCWVVGHPKAGWQPMSSGRALGSW